MATLISINSTPSQKFRSLYHLLEQSPGPHSSTTSKEIPAVLLWLRFCTEQVMANHLIHCKQTWSQVVVLQTKPSKDWQAAGGGLTILGSEIAEELLTSSIKTKTRASLSSINCWMFWNIRVTSFPLCNQEHACLNHYFLNNAKMKVEHKRWRVKLNTPPRTT